MTNWKKCKLSDLGTVIGGATPSTKVIENYQNGTISWITPKDLSNYNKRYIGHGERNITEQGLKSCSAQMMPVHSILFTSRAPIGYVAISSNEVCTNQGFKSIVPNDNTDYLFLYYLLVHNKNRIENMGSGTTFKEVSGNTMKGIEVSVPESIEDQRKIASILGSIDDKIENNCKINKNLEEQVQALYKSWFIDFAPFGGFQPSDWKTGTVDDMAKKIVCGKTPSTKKESYYGNDTPFITIPDMHDCVYVINTERSLSMLGTESQSNKTIPSNSVCVSCIGTAGLVSLVPTLSQTNQQINTIIPRDDMSPYYVYLLMKTMTGLINKLGQSGSTIVNLNKSQFGKMKILIPSQKVMKEFTNLTDSRFQIILSNQYQNNCLIKLRDTLLPRLMSGELDVTGINV